MQRLLFALIFISIICVTTLAFAKNTQCGNPDEMIKSAFAVDGMSFMATGIIGKIYPMMLFIRPDDGYFYFLLLDANYTEACKVLAGRDFQTHVIAPL